jgi:hypothetical protein
MSVELQEERKESTAPAADTNTPTSLFVSTSLKTWTTRRPEQFARDIQLNDTVYRRLDPEYYAWLRSRMAVVQKAAGCGQLDATAFEVLRVRFNAIHVWAIERYGEEELLPAVRTLRPGEYRPPMPEDEGRRWISWDEWCGRQAGLDRRRPRSVSPAV